MTPLDRLTPREREVLDLICEGLTDKEIARRLGCAYRTARNHRANLMEKIGAHNAVDVVNYRTIESAA